jgi:hypothetical protein
MGDEIASYIGPASFAFLTTSAPAIEDGSERTNAVLFMRFIVGDFLAAMVAGSVHESASPPRSCR